MNETSSFARISIRSMTMMNPFRKLMTLLGVGEERRRRPPPSANDVHLELTPLEARITPRGGARAGLAQLIAPQGGAKAALAMVRPMPTRPPQNNAKFGIPAALEQVALYQTRAAQAQAVAQAAQHTIEILWRAQHFNEGITIGGH
jgi:hypothetical protein